MRGGILCWREGEVHEKMYGLRPVSISLATQVANHLLTPVSHSWTHCTITYGNIAE